MEIKKPKLPKVGNMGKRRKAPKNETPGVAANFAYYDDNADGFDVNVRNAESGIILLEEKKLGSWWSREMPHEIATACALMSFFALMLAAAGFASTIPFLLVGVVIFTAFTFLEENFDSRVRLFAAIGVFVALAAVLIVLRKYIWGGIGTIMNSVYDMSEATQAYIYKRFETGATADEHPMMSIRSAAVWLSALAGMLAALPPASVRRAVGLGVAAYSMIAFAYYGIIPAAVCVVLTAAAVALVLARGGILSALPVLLISLMLFGVIMLINPGENYSISRADENFRDRFALRSAYLEKNLEEETPKEIEEPDDREEFAGDTQQFISTHKWVVPLLIAILIIGALAATAYLLYRRYLRRRDANREGIDSDDPKTAIIAMFPYAVRWLGAGDVDVAGKNFASLVEPLRHDVSDQYSNYYSSMYVLWREAAYSDHEMNDEKKTAMREFVDDTSEMVQSALDWRGRLKTAIKYAL